MQQTVVSIALAVLASLPLTANAQQIIPPPPPYDPPPSGWEAEPWCVEGIAGLGTPVGAYGLAVDVSPAPFLSIWAGFGTNGSGLQLAAALRLRLWPSHFQAFYVAVGGSVGAYTEPTGDSGTDRVNDRATWMNWELGYERRTGTFTWRLFGGFGRMLNVEDVHCVGDGMGVPACEEGEVWGTTLPYAGLAIGVSFD
jgi:hypothetical protein